jgi:hypothetical protein
MSDEKSRRRWISLGEVIAIAALAVSAVGVWIAWKSSTNDGPTRVVEQRQAIPLTLHARREDDGRRLEISPVESSHALESLTITIASASPITVGSDGELAASDVESALSSREGEPKNRPLSVRAKIQARYVEMGKEKSTSGSYTLRYMWKGAGLFGGRALHLIGLSRG